MSIQINPLTCINWEDIKPKSSDNLGEAILAVYNSQSPLLIATDGGHLDSSQSPNVTSASITICILDIKECESLESAEWMNRQVIPFIMRSSILPNHIGVNPSDCNHGEAMAICLQEECLPPEICRAAIMDSDSIRSRVLELRQDEAIRHRKKVRCIYPGIGKGLMSRISFGINTWKTAKDIDSLIPVLAPEKYVRFCKALESRHDKLIKTLNAFANDNIDINKLWKTQYRDNHTMKSIWKIDSHQLNADGNKMRKAPSRHPKLIPNLALLNANHWADLGATLVMKWISKNKLKHIMTRDIHYTTNEFRFFFTWKGSMIDKNTCLFLDRVLELERLKRWQSKEAHGMLGRIFPVSTLLPRDIPYKSGLRRFLLYLTNTHTRSIYKCIDYKNAATLYIANKLLAEDKNTILDTEYLNTFSIEDQLLHRCTWCNLYWNDFHERKGYEFKGNRRHMILFCNNSKISSFRKFMRYIIEDALVELHRLLSKEIGKMNENSWLFKVQDTLLLLQKHNIGKLIKKGKVKNTTKPNYWSIRQWLQKLNLCCIEEGILSEKDVLSHIFGLRHALEDGNLSEKDCEAVDCIVYGVIPKALNYCILDCFRTSTKHIQNNRTRNDT